MTTIFAKCEEYCICGCEGAENDLHCMYCTERPERHTREALADFLVNWPDENDKIKVREATGLTAPVRPN